MSAVRVFSSIVVFAAFAHLVVVLFSTAVGLMVIPSVSVLWGSAAASVLALVGVLLLHVCVDGAFTVAMRRLSASFSMCAVNLLVAHVIVIVLGVGLAAAGIYVWAQPAELELYVQAAFMLGWAVLSVALGLAVAAVWPSASAGVSQRFANRRQRSRRL